MEGFTIICNKCGNKSIFTTRTHEVHNYVFMRSDNETLKFEGDSMQIGFTCSKCENKIVQDE